MKSGEEFEFMHTFDLVLRIYLVAFILAVIVGTVLIARSCTEHEKSGVQFMKSRIVVYKLEAEDAP